MSCTHDCGCTPEIRDARTDEWVQIAPESARTATLAGEGLVKAPGQDGDLLLQRRTPAEVEWPSGNHSLHYVDEGGYQITAEDVGDGEPYPWGDARIVRVLNDAKPTPVPVLPRRIEPEDVRVGMVIEQRKGVCIMRGRVVAVEDGVFQCEVVWLRTENERNDWSLWLVEDAPAPVDPDAEALDQMAQAMANLDGSDDADEWVPWAEVALDALRETHDVTPRAEQ
jgi:hypothetical protein